MGFDQRGFAGLRRSGFRVGSGAAADPFSPDDVSGLAFWGLDSNAGSDYIRYLNDTARIRDYARTGTVRQLQPGRNYVANGTSDYVTATYSTFDAISTGCSFGGWFQRSSGKPAISVFSASSIRLEIRINASNVDFFWRADDAVQHSITSGAVTVSDFFHVAVIFSSGSQKLYINGVESASDTVSYAGETLDCNEYSIFRSAAGTTYLDGESFGCWMYKSAISESLLSELYAGGVPSTVPFIMWNCDEGGGAVAYDASGNGNDGEISAAAISTFHGSNGDNDQYSFQDEVGYTQVGTFDGSDDYVEILDHANFDITDHLSVFVRCTHDSTTISGTDSVMTKWLASGGKKEWELRFESDEKLHLRISSNGSSDSLKYSADAAVDPSSISSVGFTFDGGTVVLYIDGVSVSGTASGSATSIHNDTSSIEIGSVGGGANFWDGIVHDARIYSGTSSSVLTGANMLDIHQNGTTEFANQDLVGRWQLGEGRGLTVFDTGDNAVHHGTVQGATAAEVWARKLPVDQSDTTKDVKGGPAQYTGEAPHDMPLSAPCLHLNGSNDYVTIPDASQWNITDHLTVFVRCTNDNATISAAEVVAAKFETTTTEREWQLLFTADEKLKINFGDGTGAIGGDWTADDAVDLTEVESVAFTFDGGTVKGYINGVEVSGVSTSIPTTLNNETADILLGATQPSTPASHWDGKIWDFRIYDGTSAVLTPAQVLEMHQSATTSFSGQSLQGHWKCIEGAGAIIFDASGNRINGEGTFASEANAWASTQDTYDGIVEDGVTIATRYASITENYTQTGRITASGSIPLLSVSYWYYGRPSGTTAVLFGESNADPNNSWGVQVNTSGQHQFVYSTDGTTETSLTTSALTDDRWNHVAFTFNGSGNINAYINGSSTASHTQAATGNLYDSSADFTIGATISHNSANGMLSGVVIEETEWSGTVAALTQGNTIPSGAWYFPHGNGTETQQGLAAMTKTGTPDTIIVPENRMQITVGPGKILEDNTVDLGCGESNSVFAQDLDALIADLTYDRGDGEEADTLFVREDDDDLADDRLIVTIPALTGGDLTDMDTYTTNIS